MNENNGNGTKTEVYIKEKGILIRSEIIEIKNNNSTQSSPSITSEPNFFQEQLPHQQPLEQNKQAMYDFNGLPRYYNNKHVKPGKLHLLESLLPQEQQAVRELVIEYFNEHPELLKDSGSYNPARWAAQRRLAEALGVTSNDIRTCLRDAGLVERYAPQITNGAQYLYVFEHLDELLEKYSKIKSLHVNVYDHPKLMGVPHFYIDIMFYLAGMFESVSKTNYHAIEKRVMILELPIRGKVYDTPIKRTQPNLF